MSVKEISPLLLTLSMASMEKGKELGEMNEERDMMYNIKCA